MTTTTIQIRRKGVITLPAKLRRQYNLEEGDILALVDVGDGSFLIYRITHHVSRFTPVSTCLSAPSVWCKIHTVCISYLCVGRSQ